MFSIKYKSNLNNIEALASLYIYAAVPSTLSPFIKYPYFKGLLFLKL